MNVAVSTITAAALDAKRLRRRLLVLMSRDF
jgi:hypothetical protein